MSYSDDLARLQKKRGLAQALIQQGTQPQGMQAGKFFVGPTPVSGLASLASIIAGGVMDRKLEKKEDTLKEDRRKQLADMLGGITGQQSPAQIPTGTTPANDVPMDNPAAQKPPGMISEAGAMPSAASQAQADPKRESMLQFLQTLPIAQQEALVGQQALAKLFPSAKEGFTLGKGEKRYDATGKVIAEGAPDVKDPVAAIQEYQQAQKDGFKGSFLDYQLALKKAGATNVSTQVNTEKNLYGTMADAQGKANVELYGQAQKAPDLLNRAQRVKAALGPGSQAITGAGAEQILGLAKVAAQFGFNTGDAAADTEALGRELASATLDNIRSSGLGAGNGFTNADRDFLEKAVGGKITLEAETLRRLATLNEKSALATIQRWNATASRLKPEQLQELGMSQIELPAGSPSPGARPKLQANPDGTYTYSP